MFILIPPFPPLSPRLANKNLLFKSWGLGLVHAMQGNKFTTAWYIEPTQGKTPGRLQGAWFLCVGPLLASGPSPQSANTLTLAKTSFNDPPARGARPTTYQPTTLWIFYSSFSSWSGVDIGKKVIYYHQTPSWPQHTIWLINLPH